MGRRPCAAEVNELSSEIIANGDVPDEDSKAVKSFQIIAELANLVGLKGAVAGYKGLDNSVDGTVPDQGFQRPTKGIVVNIRITRINGRAASNDLAFLLNSR